MSDRALTTTQKQTATRITPSISGFLQRKCACGNHTVAGGECEECKKKSQMLEPRTNSSAEITLLLAHYLNSSGDAPSGKALSGNQQFAGKRSTGTQSASQERGQRQRLHQELPLDLGLDLREGRPSPKLGEVITNLPPGRPLPNYFAERLAFVPRSGLDQVRVHDDPESRLNADLLNSEGLAYGEHIVLGNRARSDDWHTAHELGHVLQQTSPTSAKGSSNTAVLENEADQFADAVVSGQGSRPLRTSPLTASQPALAQKVIWKHVQNLPNDLLLILDVDDGDFVGGCVRAIVPHVGVKLIKKFPHLQLFNLHVGVLTNPSGQFCIFFYESVTGICEMLCFPSKKELRDAWEEVKDWLNEMLVRLLKTLAIVVLVVGVAILAYLIWLAISPALLILLAA